MSEDDRKLNASEAEQYKNNMRKIIDGLAFPPELKTKFIFQR